MNYYFLTLPNKTTWEQKLESLGNQWVVDQENGKYVYGPNGEFVSIVGQNFRFEGSGENEKRITTEGFLVNIAAEELPESLKEYSFEGTPSYPKEVFF